MLQRIVERDYLNHSTVEVEMLDGVRPDLIKIVKNEGHRARVYKTYGTEWYLYLAHRIAEYPPNIYTAITDVIEFSRKQSFILLEKKQYYEIIIQKVRS